LIDRLIEWILAKKIPSVVGLDTMLEYVPEHVVNNYGRQRLDLEGTANAIYEFNRAIIDAVYEYVPAVKLQTAYYELYGPHGLETFRKTAEYARSKDLLVIGDIKRSDIGPTAKAYASAYMGQTQLNNDAIRVYDLDFVTVNPYLGSDGVMPFVEVCKKYGKGIFVLVKTSNPSSGEFQDLNVGTGKLYHWVAAKVNEWGRELAGSTGYSRVGAVVGATYPKQLEELRKRMPGVYFLIPGYGAQGGGVEDVLSGFNDDGLGAIINSSRSVICAYMRSPWKEEFPPRRFADAARAEVLRMRREIDTGLSKKGLRPW